MVGEDGVSADVHVRVWQPLVRMLVRLHSRPPFMHSASN